MLLPANFDPTQELVAARFFPAHDMEYGPGDTVKLTELGRDREDGTLDTDTALRLWMVGYLVYAKDYRPTPTETPQDEAARLVQMEDVGNGWYLLTTPWGGEGEKVHGQEAAEERRAELIAKGDTKGVTLTEGENGWYEVNAPWLDEPRKVHGSEAADVEEAMLIQDGAPAGWVPETAEEKAARLQADADRIAAQEQADQDAKDAEERAQQEAQDKADREAAEKAEAERAAALEAAGITVTTKGGGYYEVASPTLAEPVKVRGKDAADAKVGELLEAHQASQTITNGQQQEPAELVAVEGDAANVLVHVGDGDWTVSAPWLEAPETFTNVEAAEARQAELREAGAPEGWSPSPGEGATDEAPAEGVAQDKAEGEE